ncbi:BON domain-containing protein [Tardiphaga sp. OK245]|uniref:BON domain-containing protein n=1 Tax=Tardiphaga sp. OK245 TaxID=1855306 RepID=UPI001FCCD384|nr:BON domain-containing protein [Tardiphaga sp. OK245]
MKLKIESALTRDAGRVTVKDGHNVILEGNVDCWGEKRAVENAAWSTPGASAVDDRLTIN